MIRPLPGYCLILPIEDDGKTSKGVYLPDSSKDKPSRGKVVAIAPEEMVTVGQTVIYKKYTNQEAEDEGKTYLLVPFQDLLAVIE